MGGTTSRAFVMPNYKLTTFFNLSDEEAGWTEVWYFAGLSIDMALTGADAYARARNPLLGANAGIIGVRVSDEAFFGDSFVKVYQTGDLPGPDSTINCAPAFNCVDVRCEAGSLYRRTLFVRGLPNYFVDTHTPGPQGNWPISFATWSAAAIAVPVCLRVLDPKGPAAYTQIASYAPSGADIIVSSPGHGLIAGDRVKLTKTGYEVLDKTFVVLSADLNTFTVHPRFQPVTSVITLQGRWRKLEYIYPPITSTILGRVRRRAAGRPFGLLRGRSPLPRP